MKITSSQLSVFEKTVLKCERRSSIQKRFDRMPPLKRDVGSGFDNSGDQNQPRILFVAEAMSLAHVGRTALLARWAKEEGYCVDFACGSAYAFVAEAEGLKPRNLYTLPPEKLSERLANAQFFYTAEDLERYVEADRALLEAVKPDLVVSDMRLTMDIATRLARIPQLTLVNAHWSPAGACPIPAPQRGFFGWLPDGLSRMLFPAVRGMVFRYFAGALDATRRRYGLPPLHDFRKSYCAGTFCAYLDLPELESLPQLPSGHFYLGPLPWKPENQAAPNLECLRPGHPLAYLSMGSSGDKRVIPILLGALLNKGFNVVLSGISEREVSQWPGTRDGKGTAWISETLCDPESVLRSAAVTVCHGGNGTVYQSLAHGVALLCVPDNPDQALVTRAVVAAGAGLALRSNEVTISGVESALTALHEDLGFKHAATELGQGIHRWNVRERWSQWLAGFVLEQRAK